MPTCAKSLSSISTNFTSKYYSNTEFKKKFKTTIAAFGLQAEDTEQVQGYAEGLRQEFPRAHIECYVIYCIGNQGFRVFPVP